MIFNIPSWNKNNIFSLNIQLMFLLCFVYPWLFLFCFLKLVFSLNLIHFYLMYYQDNNTEHHKVMYPPYSRNCTVLQKKKNRKQNKQKALLFLETKKLCSLLITGRHYSLLVIRISSRIQIPNSLSMWTANMPLKKSILSLQKQQYIKSSTT